MSTLAPYDPQDLDDGDATAVPGRLDLSRREKLPWSSIAWGARHAVDGRTRTYLARLEETADRHAWHAVLDHGGHEEEIGSGATLRDAMELCEAHAGGVLAELDELEHTLCARRGTR